MLYRECVVSTILLRSCVFFFFNDTATTEIYTLSLHDALPISYSIVIGSKHITLNATGGGFLTASKQYCRRSEERFSRNAETDVVCRLLPEKKKRADQGGLPSAAQEHSGRFYDPLHPPDVRQR